MTRYVSPLKRAHVREVAHTTMKVAGAICMVFAAVVSAALAVGTIHIMMGLW